MPGDRTKPLVIAHRGFSGVAPENTLAAFQAAMAIGADMIELDVHLSRDGELVVLHDPDLRRTTNGRGTVRALPLSSIQSFDAGSWFHRAFAGERVPTLREVIELCRGKVGLDIEIKNPFPGYPGIVDKVLHLIRMYHLTADEVLLSSFDARLLVEIHRKAPSLPIGLITRHYSPALLSQVQQLRATYILYWLRATRTVIRQIKATRTRLFIWTVNHRRTMRRLLRESVDGIITKYPDRLQEEMRTFSSSLLSPR
ncbi:MAG: glycerophosphodiester phosphodiesterase [Nitrospinota bacterium]|nr:MAG: glycerophosphodiester phosphodiesterase [Nitrospinota bacterium]